MYVYVNCEFNHRSDLDKTLNNKTNKGYRNKNRYLATIIFPIGLNENVKNVLR